MVTPFDPPKPAVLAAVVVYALANAIALVVFLVDKGRASRGARRTPERTLHALTLVGPLGALVGIFGLRHKTKKPAFLVVTAIVVVVHVGLAAIIAWLVTAR